MCIRDRHSSEHKQSKVALVLAGGGITGVVYEIGALRAINDCLLYTSDAADERSSVDLGGRRIIKKKKNSDYQ